MKLILIKARRACAWLCTVLALLPIRVERLRSLRTGNSAPIGCRGSFFYFFNEGCELWREARRRSPHRDLYRALVPVDAFGGRADRRRMITYPAYFSPFLGMMLTLSAT
jgi:hypothetical protein